MLRYLFVLLLFCATSSYAQTTFILVRHAEKEANPVDPKDPFLSAEGQQRAQSLAKLLDRQTLDAIFSTNFNRTKNTVDPVAKAKGINIQTYESFKEGDLEKLKTSGGTILICGHSNTIPAIANLLIGKSQFSSYEDSDYGNLLIIKDSSVTHLRF